MRTLLRRPAARIPRRGRGEERRARGKQDGGEGRQDGGAGKKDGGAGRKTEAKDARTAAREARRRRGKPGSRPSWKDGAADRKTEARDGNFGSGEGARGTVRPSGHRARRAFLYNRDHEATVEEPRHGADSFASGPLKPHGGPRVYNQGLMDAGLIVLIPGGIHVHIRMCLLSQRRRSR
jgi:hypothetical protein